MINNFGERPLNQQSVQSFKDGTGTLILTEARKKGEICLHECAPTHPFHNQISEFEHRIQ